MALAVDQGFDQESGQDTYAWVMAGAGNVPELKELPNIVSIVSRLLVAPYFHSKATSRLHRPLKTVSEASGFIVPKFLGIGHPDWSYGWIKAEMDEQVRRAGQRRKVVIALSLAGTLSAKYAAENPEEDIEVLTVSSPFRGSRRLKGSEWFLGKMTEQIFDLRDDLGDDAPKLTEVGSDGDRTVTTYSALPDLPNAQRLVLTSDSNAALARGYTPIEVDRPPNHLRVHTHPAVISTAQDMVHGTEAVLRVV